MADFLFSLGAVVWSTAKVVSGISSIVRSVKNIFSDISGLRRIKDTTKGQTLEDKIERLENQRSEIFQKSASENLEQYFQKQQAEIYKNNQYFTAPVSVDPRVVKNIAASPNDYGLKKGQLLREAKNLSMYYTDGVYMPFIFRDSNRDLIIAEMPIQIFRYNFVQPWDTPLTLKRLNQFGIVAQEIRPEVSRWFSLLPKEKQIYFSQLYKDYCHVAKSVEQKDIPSETIFFQDIFYERERIKRELGVASVVFDLQIEHNAHFSRRVILSPRTVAIQQ